MFRMWRGAVALSEVVFLSMHQEGRDEEGKRLNRTHIATKVVSPVVARLFRRMEEIVQEIVEEEFRERKEGVHYEVALGPQEDSETLNGRGGQK